MELKKQAIAEKLKKRDDSRVEALQQRKAEKESSCIAQETTDYFRKQFNDNKDKIDKSLSEIQTMPETLRSASLDELVVMVQTLQKLLTDSTQFLSSYSVQSAQDTINRLKDSIETQRAMLVPKKKFAFKGGKKKDVVDTAVTNSQPTEAKSSKTDRPSTTTELFGFSNRDNEELVLSSAELCAKKVYLSSLKNCTVRLHGPMLALTLNNLTGCAVSCGPVSGPVFVDDCSCCEVSVACQQLRVHTTTATTFYLHVTSRAIIEDCTRILTAPYTANYESIEQQLRESGLDRDRNSWDDLDDFNWLAKDKRSPNWSVLEPERRREWK